MDIFKLFTKEQVGGFVRAALAALSGAFIAKGWGDASLWEAISGAVVLLVTGVWSWKVKT
jgi:hypothetical protein